MSGATHYGVVVGVDGSAASKMAVTWAARDAARRGEQLSLVHVMPSPLLPTWPESPFPDTSRAWHEEQGRQFLDAAERVAVAAIADLGPVTLSCRALTGAPIPTLVNLSKDATMVVVGRSGGSALHRRFVGSVASGLLHHARAPVAVIPRDALGAEADERPVLLGVDGPPATEAAIEIAFDEASQRGVELIALHAWDRMEAHGFTPIERERQGRVGESALAERLMRWQQEHPEVVVDRRVVFGAPTRALVEASGSAQLTVVGSHGGGGFAGMLLGSLTSVVVQVARTPVIVGRAP